MKTIHERIDSVDDKDALYVVNQLTSSILRKMPGVETADDLPQVLDSVARETGTSLQDLPTNWVEATVDSQQAGEVARELLHALATPGNGAEFVAAALDEFPSEDQDLGLLSIPIAAGFFYIAVVSDLDLDLGWFKIKKKGLPAARQVELGKSLLPKIFGDWLKNHGEVGSIQKSSNHKQVVLNRSQN
ncbi:MAG: hypothetical protein P0119_12310 [Nitrospira sp.]|nr:hypothetical protein [Nitrospira sp.]